MLSVSKLILSLVRLKLNVPWEWKNLYGRNGHLDSRQTAQVDLVSPELINYIIS